MPIEQTAASAAPYVRSIVRIAVALLFLEHGLSRLFGWPSPLPTPPVLTMYWFAGAIELVGGVLLCLGLFTRPVAFIMSGEMAFAYFISHAPRGFFHPERRRRRGPVLLHLLVFRLRRGGAMEPGCDLAEAGLSPLRFWPAIRSEIGVKAGHIGQVGNQQREDQRFFDHHTLLKIGAKPEARIVERSLNGSGARVPKYVFSGIQIPFTGRSPWGSILIPA